MKDTNSQFDSALALCRKVFAAKLTDYGASWRILRPAALTDQIFIKAKRIRTLQESGDARIDEDELAEFIGIVNYGLIGVIQLRRGYSDTKDMSIQEALAEYDKTAHEARELMVAKNHDYDEAWRMMRVLSYDDLILQKVLRTKEIEDNQGVTHVSEGIDANYLDMVNYSVFAIIKLTETPDAAE